MGNDIELLAKQIGDNVIKEAKGLLNEAWHEISVEDKEIIERCALRLGQLSLERLQGKDVEADIAIINATLGNMTYVKASRVSKAFWNAFEKIATSLLGGLLGLATKGLAGV